MSVDTITRIASFIDTNITVPNSYEMIDLTLNESWVGEENQGSGPWIQFDIEEFDDDIAAVGDSANDYFENGVVVFNIFDEQGSGTRDPYTIKDVIRDAFRANPRKGGLTALLGSGGNIMFTNITYRPFVVVDRSNSDLPWHRHDILVNYQKVYEV